MEETKTDTDGHPKENGPADRDWVVRPTMPNGTSIELASFTKSEHVTPDMLELLQQLMTRVQESELGEGAVDSLFDSSCPELKSCNTFNHGGGGCPKLESCTTFKKSLPE
ncbi:hypothetical protein ACWEN3_01145 [Streptomyces sp. NPDC004561]